MIGTQQKFTDNRTGVYRIRNKVNGKFYIGSAADSFRSRWGWHRSYLRRGTHSNRYLQRSWEKYGEKSFVFEVVCFCGPDVCLLKEQFYIDSLNACNREIGYNISPTANSTLGLKHAIGAKSRSDKRRKEQSEAKKKLWQDPVYRASQSELRKKAWQDPVFRQKQISARRGKKLTEEHKAKIGLSSIGKKHTEETKEKMRLGKLGHLVPQSTRDKISIANKGRVQPEEEKIRRAKSLKAYWQKIREVSEKRAPLF